MINTQMGINQKKMSQNKSIFNPPHNEVLYPSHPGGQTNTQRHTAAHETMQDKIETRQGGTTYERHNAAAITAIAIAARTIMTTRTTTADKFPSFHTRKKESFV
jgi:hypothetical protein